MTSLTRNSEKSTLSINLPTSNYELEESYWEVGHFVVSPHLFKDMNAHWISVSVLMRNSVFRIPVSEYSDFPFVVNATTIDASCPWWILPPCLVRQCAPCRQWRRCAAERTGAVNLQLDPEEKQQLDRPFWERRGFSITTWGVEGCPKRATEPSWV